MRTSKSCFLILLPLAVLFLIVGLNPILVQGGTVPTITLPKKTITVFDVAILKPIGDPVTAPSLDNQFTYSGAAGVATVSVEANVTPGKVEGEVKDLIKWTFTSIPAGSVLTWNNPWPGEPTAGQGKSAIATLTGYPTNNSDFNGPSKFRTIKMEVIRNGKVLKTKTTPIQLFFKAEDTATGRSVPNWIYYWSQAIGSSANVEHGTPTQWSGFGVTPAMAYWSYTTPHDKTKIIVYDLAKDLDDGTWPDYVDTNGISQSCTPANPIMTTGIDAFRDTIIHESQHVLQIAQADTIVGTVNNTPWRYGWSWSWLGAVNHNHWSRGNDGKPGAAGVDDDGVNGVDDLTPTGPGELGNGDDVVLSRNSSVVWGHGNDSDWPKTWTLPTGCWATGFAIETPAYSVEPNSENAMRSVDWAEPGKQHLTSSYLD